ncbi:AraC family transcriptional regulator [Candidatus Binatia bacterium]|nr:AraC family transcriptional regulator [Candidatus Binatia bacterium]
MNRIPFIRAGVVHRFVAFLRQVGAPVTRYLGEAGIGAEALDDPEALVPTVFTFRFLEICARRSGIDDLGLRVGATIDPLTLGSFGRKIAGAGTIGRALLTSIAERPSWHSGERVWMTRQRDVVELNHRYVLPAEEDWGQAVGTNLVAHLNLLQHTVPGATPAHVELPVHPSPAFAELPALAGVPISFDRPRTVIAFHPRTLAQPLLDGHPGAAPASSATSSPPLPVGLVPSVEAFVASVLGVQQPRIELVAEAIGMNARTLQRRFAEAGVTYGELVSHTRLRLARERLVASDAKIVEIALGLGYTDAAHFTRAFKRWTGIAPVAYRAMHATPDRTRRAS